MPVLRRSARNKAVAFPVEPLDRTLASRVRDAGDLALYTAAARIAGLRQARERKGWRRMEPAARPLPHTLNMGTQCTHAELTGALLSYSAFSCSASSGLLAGEPEHQGHCDGPVRG